jgi:hypothetical protein
MPFRPAARGLSWLFVLFSAGCLIGCETLPNWRQPADSKSPAEIEEEHRAKYQETRDPAALRWLLAQRLENGMSLEDVGRVLGEDGEREFNDQRFKEKEGRYRVDDEMYRFGPDAQGQVYYLGFRDNRLVNFNGRDYHDGDMRKPQRHDPNL